MQIVHSTRRGSREIEHLGSAHDEAEVAALQAAARQRLAQGQGVLDLGLDSVASSGPLEVVSSRMGHLWDALCRAYYVLGFDQAARGDAVFRDLVLARVIEATSKLDSLRGHCCVVRSRVGLRHRSAVGGHCQMASVSSSKAARRRSRAG